MPFRRRFRVRARRAPRRRRNKYGLATIPRMMSRSYKFKRMNQVDTRVAWFKINGEISLNDQPNQYYEFRTAFLYAANPNGWAEFTRLYDQFKILGFTYKLFPANVGTEATAGSNTLGTPIYTNRGNHVIWTDQRFDPNVQQPVQINEIINTASARLFNPRRPYTRSIWRPKGKYAWGSTRDFTTTAPDPWSGSINHLINDGTVQPANTDKIIYFYSLTYKVVFRGRQDD